MKTCDDALVANPSDAPALAWRGGGFLFLGAQALRRGEPAKGSELYAKGLQQMQSAVDLGPNNISVRIIRGATLQDAARRSPGPAEAEQLMRTALEDYEKTLSLQEPYFDRVPAHGRGELLLGLADGYSRTGDRGTAAAFFERIRKELPGSAYAQSASQWLETRTPLGSVCCSRSCSRVRSYAPDHSVSSSRTQTPARHPLDALDQLPRAVHHDLLRNAHLLGGFAA